jgi:hypothetical protein
MRARSLCARHFSESPTRDSICLRIGPYLIKVASSLPCFFANLQLLYEGYIVETGSSFADFHVSIHIPSGTRRWVRPYARFAIDGQPLFHPVPVDHAIAAFEWGLNWCIANYSHEHLMIHAAVVERDGAAIVLPGEPGAGKSTLCAALVSRGWRLLSDEMALISLTDHSLIPVPRPIALKNESIDVIRRFAPDAVFGPLARDTAKGDVAHVRPPAESVRRADEPAAARWIVFPHYTAGEPTTLTPETKGKAFMRLAGHSFNYHVLGRLGFDTLGDLMDDATPFDLTYSDLDDAVSRLGTLAA